MYAINQVISGIWSAYPSANFKINENIALKGNSTENIVVAQLYQASWALDLANRVQFIPSSTWTISYVGIISLALLARQTPHWENYYLKHTVHFLQGNIGSLCQLVSLVSAAVLIGSGAPIFGAISMSITLLGYVQRHTSYLPLSTTHYFGKVAMLTTLIAQLVFGSWPTRLLALFFFAAFPIKNILAKYLKLLPEGIPFQERVSGNKTMELELTHTEYRVEGAHIHLPIYHIPPLPQNQPIDFSVFTTFFDTIDWTPKSGYLKIAEGILACDDNWTGGKQKYNEDKIDYIRRGLTALVSKAQQSSSIEMISPISFESATPVRTILGHLALKFATLTMPITEKAKMLVSLGCAGHYCEAGNYDAAFQYYREITNQTIALKERILHLLAMERKRLLEKHLQLIDPNLVLQAKIDLHTLHLLVSVWGPDIGHPDYVQSSMDVVATGTAPSSHLLTKYARNFSEEWGIDRDIYEEMAQEYNPIQIVADAIDKGLISIDDIKIWAAAKRKVFKELYEEEDGTLKNSVLYEILLDAGVLKKRS